MSCHVGDRTRRDVAQRAQRQSPHDRTDRSGTRAGISDDEEATLSPVVRNEDRTRIEASRAAVPNAQAGTTSIRRNAVSAWPMAPQQRDRTTATSAPSVQAARARPTRLARISLGFSLPAGQRREREHCPAPLWCPTSRSLSAPRSPARRRPASPTRGVSRPTNAKGPAGGSARPC